jgi:2,5-diketo-D-gluconate reductase A
MHTIVLNNSGKMPLLGFGVFQVTEAGACENAVLDALQTGHRMIDTAASYLNEAEVGRGITQSGVAREELFITSKLWVQDTGYEQTKKAFDKSLKRVNQIEAHPFNQQIETQKFLKANNVQIESWGPFAECKNNMFHNEVLVSIAGKHKKSVAQVILRWMTQRGIIVIPKSVRK